MQGVVRCSWWTIWEASAAHAALLLGLASLKIPCVEARAYLGCGNEDRRHEAPFMKLRCQKC